MALYCKCRISKNALLQTVLLVILPTGTWRMVLFYFLFFCKLYEDVDTKIIKLKQKIQQEWFWRSFKLRCKLFWPTKILMLIKISLISQSNVADKYEILKVNYKKPRFSRELRTGRDQVVCFEVDLAAGSIVFQPNLRDYQQLSCYHYRNDLKQQTSLRIIWLIAFVFFYLFLLEMKFNILSSISEHFINFDTEHIKQV